MQVAPEVSYKNIASSQRIKQRVAKELAHLEKIYPRLISCKVLVERPDGTRGSKGHLARVRLHLGLPGGREVAVSHRSDDNHAHEDVTDYYFHENEVTGGEFDQLTIGEAITFRPDMGKKGPMARTVHRRKISKTTS